MWVTKLGYGRGYKTVAQPKERRGWEVVKSYRDAGTARPKGLVRIVRLRIDNAGAAPIIKPLNDSTERWDIVGAILSHEKDSDGSHSAPQQLRFQARQRLGGVGAPPRAAE